MVSYNKLLLALAFAGVLILTSCSPGRQEDIRFSNEKEIIQTIREGLRMHSERINISFGYYKDISEHMQAVVDDWMALAEEETGRADEGDYIVYQTGGYVYHSTCEKSDGRFLYRIQIAPKYYMYLAQEEDVTAEVARVLEELQINDSLSDFEKAERIYDYVCRNVSYDKVHRKNEHYNLRSTAYAALIQKTATCQGYCTALYRLLREAGLSTRIVTGYMMESSELHAWMMIGLEGTYYYADATRDSGEEGTEYQFFLKGNKSFSSYETETRFKDPEFKADYPLSETDYR